MKAIEQLNEGEKWLIIGEPRKNVINELNLTASEPIIIPVVYKTGQEKRRERRRKK